MPFSRATLQDIIKRTQADIESRLVGTDPKLRRSLLNIISRALSGAVHGLYGYLDWMADQIIIDKAEKEMLDRHANIRLSQPRKSAISAIGNVICTGIDATLIPAGSLLQRSDGVEFATDADATIISGTVDVTVIASVGGANGNTVAASELTFVTPIADINSTATVTATGLIDGLDTESDDDLRGRLISRIQKPAQGGAKHDYIAWALEVAGVTRAWCYPLEDGAGTVKTRFMMDDKYVDGIPLGADVTTTHDYINALRPVGLAIGGYITVAPIAIQLDFTLSVAPNTQAVKDAVEAELKDMILRDSEPGGTIRITRINEAISLAANETDHVLTIPAANVVHAINEIATMGTITWS